MFREEFGEVAGVQIIRGLWAMVKYCGGLDTSNRRWYTVIKFCGERQRNKGEVQLKLLTNFWAGA